MESKLYRENPVGWVLGAMLYSYPRCWNINTCPIQSSWPWLLGCYKVWSDLKDGAGLSKIVHLTKKHMLPIPIVEFGIDDIVRSDICKLWIETFMKEGL